MLKQSIEPSSEAYYDGPVPASNTAVSDECCWEKELSDIATRLTSTIGVESRISDFVSFLARVFGGGLRTSW